jgi:microcystin-dependent protein
MCRITRLLAFLLLWPTLASANVPCTLPFNLQNGTTADANQVMANYNALVTCLGQAAAAGVNSDITQLLGLTSGLPPAFGGSSHYIGATSTGTNTIAVTVIPATFTLSQGNQVSFTVGGTDTGASTLNVNNTGAINLMRPLGSGPSAFAGGEFVAGNRVLVEYDGTNWQWLVPPIQLGQVTDSAGPSCPPNLLNANFQAISRTAYPALFSFIGTTWGAGDGVTTFNVPDLRNRATYGQDQNVGGLSDRITVAGNNFDGTVIGGVGGLQNSTAVAAHTHTITDPGHTHSLSSSVLTPGSSFVSGSNAAFSTTSTVTATSSTTGITINSAGAASYSVLAPAAIVTKCIQP